MGALGDEKCQDSRLRKKHRNRTTRVTGESSVHPDNGGTRGWKMLLIVMLIDLEIWTNNCITVKPVFSGYSKIDKTEAWKPCGILMQVRSTAECSMGEHSAVLLTCIKRLSVLKAYFLSSFEWPLKTGFPVPEERSLCQDSITISVDQINWHATILRSQILLNWVDQTISQYTDYPRHYPTRQRCYWTSMLC